MIKRQPALQDSHTHPLILSPIIRRLLYLQGSLSPLPPRRGAWLTGSPLNALTSRRQWTVEPCCTRPRKGPPPPEGGPSSWYGYCDVKHAFSVPYPQAPPTGTENALLHPCPRHCTALLRNPRDHVLGASPNAFFWHVSGTLPLTRSLSLRRSTSTLLYPRTALPPHRSTPMPSPSAPLTRSSSTAGTSRRTRPSPRTPPTSGACTTRPSPRRRFWRRATPSSPPPPLRRTKTRGTPTARPTRTSCRTGASRTTTRC